MATKMRQSMAEFEQAFAEQAHVERMHDRVRRETARRREIIRSHQRQLDRVHRHGTVRFVALVLALTATVVGVTVGMFQLLLAVMG